jgi:tRNA threonylcarbamoyladenosine biosynthesis protein TsaB
LYLLQLLAFDSATPRCSAALWVHDQLTERVAGGAHQHADVLLPLAHELLAAAHCTPRQLDAIAFSAGPGAFTGVRIACGIAQGLALGLNIPVVPISSLLALAAASNQPRVIAALDARMEEIYHAAYERTGDAWRCVSPPCVCAPSRAPQLEGGGWCGAGSGFRAYGEALRARYAGALVSIDAAAEPSAAQVARLAAQAYARGESVPAHWALPVYLRDKVALTSLEQAARRKANV